MGTIVIKVIKVTMETSRLGHLCIGCVSVVAMLVGICILCSFAKLPRHGLLGGSLNEGVSSICLVVQVLRLDGLVWTLILMLVTWHVLCDFA